MSLRHFLLKGGEPKAVTSPCLASVPLDRLGIKPRLGIEPRKAWTLPVDPGVGEVSVSFADTLLSSPPPFRGKKEGCEPPFALGLLAVQGEGPDP